MEKKPYTKPRTQTARRSTTQRRRLSESEGDGTCVVCAQSIEIYAVGQCDHYICFKCSTKIRLLCEEDLCPVCRKELPRVIFSKKKDKYEHLVSLKLIKDKDYDVGVYFADLAIIKDYRQILEHRCPVCPNRPPDRTFDQTKAHLRKEHTLFYCEICLEHNRTFTSECKVYSRKDLATHKRIGDPDDKSHRGHPLCEYCDERFLDDDKLFHHLRTTHFYCHLCDHGETNEFYGTYPDLRAHFKEQHYLCEEGDCINEEFTSVFGTEIDFKAHIASVHKESRSKQQQKKDRQLNLGFQYARREPPPARGRGGSSRGNDRSRPQRDRPNGHADYSSAFERDSDLARAITLSKEEKEKADRKAAKNNDKEASKQAKTQDFQPSPPAENNLAFTQTDFPNLKASIEEIGESSNKSEGQMIKNGSGNNLLLWSKDPKNMSSKFQSAEEFPSLPTPKPGTTRIRSTPTKSVKPLKKASDTSERPTSSANKSSSKNKKGSKGFKSTEDGFPKLDSRSKVKVGRGSAKHLEGFESYADGATSNVTVVSAQLKEQIEGKNKLEKPAATFEVLKGDFPSLSSTSSRVSAPPGFGNVTPNPFLLGKASLPTKTKKTDPKSTSSSTVKPPPGFGTSSKNEQNQNTIQNNKNNGNFLSGLDNFPSFVYPAEITPASVNSDFEVSNHSTNELNHSSVKSTSSSKKKSKGYNSRNRDTDFPALPLDQPDYWHVPAQPSQQTSKASKRQPPATTDLNLANVFDFPSL